MPTRTSRRARVDRRRRRRLERLDQDLSGAQWAALLAAWGGCAYCGSAMEPLQRDCVLPVSRGGRYTLDNVVPACRSCNTSKCANEVTGWLRRKRLDERAFLLRHLVLRTELGQRFRVAPGPTGTDFREGQRSYRPRPERGSDGERSCT